MLLRETQIFVFKGSESRTAHAIVKTQNQQQREPVYIRSYHVHNLCCTCTEIVHDLDSSPQILTGVQNGRGPEIGDCQGPPVGLRRPWLLLWLLFDL